MSVLVEPEKVDALFHYLFPKILFYIVLLFQDILL